VEPDRGVRFLTGIDAGLGRETIEVEPRHDSGLGVGDVVEDDFSDDLRFVTS
jgi:hypothetical protein